MSPTLTAHAAERWANVVTAVVASPFDPRNLDGWARAARAGRGTLRSWCRAAGLSAKASLDFARLLRAVVRSQGQPWDPHNILDVVDPRTMRRLVERGGLAMVPPGSAPPTAREFLERQRLILEPEALKAVTARLLARPVVAGASQPAIERPLAS
jgi:hypothetical protein